MATLAHDASPRFGRFTLRTDCPRCGVLLPLNGPAQDVDCADCGHRTRVPDQVLVGLLDQFEEAFPRTDKGTTDTGDVTWRWTFEALEAPACPRCQATLPDAGSAALVPCAQCGAQVPSHPAPPWLQAGPRVTRVIGGDLELTREDREPKPVVLACPACGAGLTVTGRHDRLTPCEHCGVQVHLPDAVWRALHPPKTVEPWVARFEGPSRPAIRAEQQAREREQRAAAELHKAQQRAESRKRDEALAEERRRHEQLEADQEQAERRARDERASQRNRWTLAPTLVCFALSLGVVGILGVSAAAWVVGHVPGLRIVGVSYTQTRILTDWVLVLALAPVLPVWALSVGVAALRGGNRLVSLLAWSAFLAGMTMIPGIGVALALIWALQHFRGTEPTPDDRQLPMFTGWPLGVLFLVVPAYAQLSFLAVGDLGLLGF